jgi:hypothetical protein
VEKITSKEALIAELKEVRAVERQARSDYIEDVKEFSDENITKPIAKIKLDEDRHIELLDGLISLLEGK